ncbi:ubiquitin ligase complex subunit HRD3 [Aspergillus aculeatinus CBS 121060]|uniref:Ubiquitin-protein ligase Sel1/Ubx2 n=1 Tax=Aspergillus aculeatinus CBS 121060 TaxID=1448322 RepID=A0ACD1H516_9EURO|nr:putative ubiquitin-protein ligase Sel1/Ubx2 [Aspergillus aculeatinus CBS 121060]RAH68669.1 putative ubiquitin-protein ligase Sel1/Ubx2 [Aspergillus aculeatinus CBS 121060]
MKNRWLWHILPLALLLLLQAFLVDCYDQTDDLSSTIDAVHESQTPFVQSSSRSEDAQLPLGQERVEHALRILRDSKLSVVAPDTKPSGLVGYAWYYAQEAFRILFMNAPSSSSDGYHAPKQKIHPDVAKAVHELTIAAEEAHNPDAMFLLAEMNFYGNFTHSRDFQRAFHWYQALASATGNSTAQYMLGFMYGTGVGGSVQRDQAKSLLYHTFAAEAGNTRSEMTLAYRHHQGVGAPRDCDQATYYYKQVADKAIAYLRSGPPGGQSMIRESYRWADEEGGVYGEGASVSTAGLRDSAHSGADANLEDVLEYLDLMSRKGELKATFSLGKMYYEGGRGLPRNFRRAMRYFKQVTRRYWNQDGSVNPNHPQGIEKLAAKAAGHVGLMYLRGEGVEQNFATASSWFRRGLANGDALCQHELGLIYLHGYGVTPDAFRAASYFRSAADQDFPAAETRLGALFLDQGDVPTATKYFELAARWGSMEAFYYLAELSNNGVGRKRHCAMAASYYKMVAERAEAIHSSFEEANTAYENGDKERALIPAMMAAEQGYEHAQSNVAFLLDEQRSLVSLDSILPGAAKKSRPALLRNAALALIYWTRSAKQANIDSLIKMGDYYLSGTGIAADAEKASTCYHTAAEAHYSAQAYWNLGWMHENGVAVDQDFHMAKRYYDLALETSPEAYLPVKLSLLKLRMRGYWNWLTNGDINPIQEEEAKPHRTFKEWIAAFIENDEEEEANYRAQLYKRGEDEEEDLMSAGRGLDERHNHEDGYYDDLDLDIDESVLEGLIIVGLAATLLILVYMRQQRNRQRQDGGNLAVAGGGNGDGNGNGNGNGIGNGNGVGNGNGNGFGDRGFFPRPGDPEFAQWAAGGVGH